MSDFFEGLFKQKPVVGQHFLSVDIFTFFFNLSAAFGRICWNCFMQSQKYSLGYGTQISRKFLRDMVIVNARRSFALILTSCSALRIKQRRTSSWIKFKDNEYSR